MDKKFRPWQVDDVLLLPPSVQDFVPSGHIAHFVRDVVREELDLSAILSCYSDPRGYPAYDPRMLTALLLYGYSQGVYSSRRLSRGCEERVDFMAVTAMNRPDFRTISDFRKRHLDALGGLFVQILTLCRKAGLVKLGHVALDGTKLKANASKNKAMSYGRMGKREEELAAEVAAWFAAAAAADKVEDTSLGADRRGDEPPDWMKKKQDRLERIRQAKAALEAEAKAAAAEKAKQEPKHRGGRKPKTPPGQPKDGAQHNFTDPESRIMKGRDGFIQAYNGQAAVDAAHQIIVAQSLTDNASDQASLVPLVDAIKQGMGRKPREISADSGYCSEQNLSALEERNIRGYVATGREKKRDGGEEKRRGPQVTAMRTRLKLGGHQSRYRLRKQVVEPVFGQIKQARGFRQFLLRGLHKVSAEWALICAVHNLLKLAKAA